MLKLWFTAFLLAMPLVAGAVQPRLLEPDRAFQFQAEVKGRDAIEVRYIIAPGYYLYRGRLHFTAEPASIKLGAPELPPGEKKHDQFLGDVVIYRGVLNIRLPYSNPQGLHQFTLVAGSQGCADAGVCYVPQEHKAVLRLAEAAGAAPPGPELRNAPVTALFEGGAPANDDLRVASLFHRAPWLVVLSFFGFGLLLSLTPCCLPMVPILSSIIVGHGHRVTHRRGFLLSAAYVLGLALTYAVAGVAAGLSGAVLSAFFQNAWVLGAFAGIFVLLAGGMFGFYKLQLPQAFQSRLLGVLNRLPGGHYAGVFVMGALSALIAGPCVAAPLAGALLYISQTGNIVLGGSALFVMALGMGVPLLAVGVSAGTLLPRTGPWMQTVQRFFGVVLLGVAIYFVSSLVSVRVQMGAWAILLIFWGVYLRALDRLPDAAGGFARFCKGVGIVGLVAGIVYLVGALAGAQDFRRPLPFLRPAVLARAAPSAPLFQRVSSLAGLDAAVRSAGGKPVMLDFYADWCASCQEMEHETFSNPRVRVLMGRFVALQADVTRNSPDDIALLRRFRLFGPPGIVFFGADGRENEALRVIGFQPPADFVRVLDRALAAP